MKIILASDNHYNTHVLKYILERESDADMYLHCGDSELEMSALMPFVSVLGNNDYDRNYPRVRFLEAEGKRIEMLHGNPYVSSFSDNGLVAKAIQDKADIVFFGHTHVFADYEKEGIRFINPGSCNFNRDGTCPSYAVVTIGKEGVTVQRVDIDPQDYIK